MACTAASSSDTDEDWEQTLDVKLKFNEKKCDKNRSRFDLKIALPVEKGTNCFISHHRAIVHIDIDCFYAQVEMIQNPALRDKPLGIQQKHIIVTCNYIAREYGVTKLMYLSDALKKCPSLCVVKGEDLTKYREMSYKITELLSKYSNKVERLGFDENFMDVTELVKIPPWCDLQDSPVGFIFNSSGVTGQSSPSCSCGCTGRLNVASNIAAEMRKNLYEELGITCCAGIGHNKLLSKLVGEQNKPNKQTLLYPQNSNQLMLSIEKLRKIPGIGHKTSHRLNSLEISTILDLQNCDFQVLSSEFGEETAETLRRLSRGEDESEVINTGRPQTLSDEDSFRICDTLDNVKIKMAELINNLIHRLEADGRIPQRIKVTVRKAVSGEKYPNRQSRQGPIPPDTFSNFLNGNCEVTKRKLLETCCKLFAKLVDTSQKFHITLLAVCFANLVAKSENSLEGFLKRPNIAVQSNSPVVSSVKYTSTCVSNSVTENTSSNKTDETLKDERMVTGKEQKSIECSICDQDLSCVESKDAEESASFVKSSGQNEVNLTSVKDKMLLSDKLKDKVDLATFLELPLFVQEEIISQLEGAVESSEVQRLKSFVGDAANVSGRLDRQVEETHCLESSQSAGCSKAGDSTSGCSGVSGGLEMVGAGHHPRVDTEVPPHFDASVFSELPTALQTTLSNEWKTTAEFKTMKKRRLSSSPNKNKSTVKKSCTITNFFRKK